MLPKFVILLLLVTTAVKACDLDFLLDDYYDDSESEEHEPTLPPKQPKPSNDVASIPSKSNNTDDSNPTSQGVTEDTSSSSNVPAIEKLYRARSLKHAVRQMPLAYQNILRKLITDKPMRRSQNFINIFQLSNVAESKEEEQNNFEDKNDNSRYVLVRLEDEPHHRYDEDNENLWYHGSPILKRGKIEFRLQKNMKKQPIVLMMSKEELSEANGNRDESEHLDVQEILKVIPDENSKIKYGKIKEDTVEFRITKEDEEYVPFLKVHKEHRDPLTKLFKIPLNYQSNHHALEMKKKRNNSHFTMFVDNKKNHLVIHESDVARPVLVNINNFGERINQKSTSRCGSPDDINYIMCIKEGNIRDTIKVDPIDKTEIHKIYHNIQQTIVKSPLNSTTNSSGNYSENVNQETATFIQQPPRINSESKFNQMQYPGEKHAPHYHYDEPMRHHHHYHETDLEFNHNQQHHMPYNSMNQYGHLHQSQPLFDRFGEGIDSKKNMSSDANTATTAKEDIKRNS